jgi:predicted outer membrane repeat protein
VVLISLAYAQYERTSIPRIRSLDWSPDGTTIAVAIETPICWGYSAQLLNANNFSVTDTLFDAYACGGLTIDFNNDGTSLVIAEGIRLTQWNLGEKKVLGSFFCSEFYRTAYWKNDNISFLNTSLNFTAVSSIILEPNLTLTYNSKIIGPADPLDYSSTWSNNSNIVAIGTEGVIYLWNPTTDVEIARFTAPDTQPIRQLVWHPTQNVLASADDAGRIILWNTTNGQIITQYLGHLGGFRDLEWRPDGQQLASVGEDDTLRIWNYPSGQMQIVSSGQKTWAIAYSPDNTRLVFGGEFEEGQALNIQSVPVVSIPPTATFTPTPIPPSPTPTATSFACTHTVVASSTSSLISALVSANSASTPSTICLGGGTYTLTAVNNSDESPNGLPSITKNITIIGNNSVIERATSAPQFRIFRVASNGRLSLNNLTVRGGHAGSLSGGGVRNLGILELNTVIVENNTGNAGGGIRNNNNATFTAINSLIRNNVSTTNGGGLYANNGSSTTLTNTNFLGNTTNASNGLGGAIFSNGNIFTMSGGIIQNNSARNGGGIFVNITTQAMSLNNVQFTGNTASNHGAGIYHLSGTTFSVQNGRFTSNIATNEGGAIAGDGTFTITNSNFVSNSANIGGAIHAQATSGSSIQQSCIENNTAPNTIGIFNEASIVLNAQNNFWGSAGASNSVSANVNTNGALMACGNGF